MKEVLLIAVSTFFATAVWSYIALEDFQSFTDGQDIAISPNWANLVPPNEIRCADLGGDEKVGVFYPAGLTRSAIIMLIRMKSLASAVAILIHRS